MQCRRRDAHDLGTACEPVDQSLIAERLTGLDDLRVRAAAGYGKYYTPPVALNDSGGWHQHAGYPSP